MGQGDALSSEAPRGVPRQCATRTDKLSRRRDRTRQALHKPPASPRPSRTRMSPSQVPFLRLASRRSLYRRSRTLRFRDRAALDLEIDQKKEQERKHTVHPEETDQSEQATAFRDPGRNALNRPHNTINQPSPTTKF